MSQEASHGKQEWESEAAPKRDETGPALRSGVTRSLKENKKQKQE